MASLRIFFGLRDFKGNPPNVALGRLFPVIGPFNEDQAPFFEGFFQPEVLVILRRQPVKIRMGDGNAGLVFVDKREGWAADVFPGEAFHQPPDQDCFSGTQSSGKKDEKSRKHRQCQFFPKVMGSGFACREKTEGKPGPNRCEGHAVLFVDQEAVRSGTK